MLKAEAQQFLNIPVRNFYRVFNIRLLRNFYIQCGKNNCMLKQYSYTVPANFKSQELETCIIVLTYIIISCLNMVFVHALVYNVTIIMII